ncbi:MAG TPA: biotin/lipoyl-binding protein, partial [Desulfobacteraceae bacterium]|nr:biotin/lipoyl-binding protein [Desulfobacteraceae bacterium]
MKTIRFCIIPAIILAACNNSVDEADAYGSFEAVEVIVSAETGGRILKLYVNEGTDIKAGAEIALIDTTLFHLQKAEVNAGMNGVRTQINMINAQNDILRQQIENLNVNVARIENMLKDEAATKKQYD